MNAFFPINHDCSTIDPKLRRGWPRFVPWHFVERWRVQIEEDYGRTLEQLATSDGLSPVELWLAAHGREPSETGAVTEHVAARWLIAELRGRDANR
jgi:hypothetical protein